MSASYKRLTGAHIKWLAIITMFIDHIGAVILEQSDLLWQKVSIGKLTFTVYESDRILRAVGRFAFPAFCFLLVEGFTYTRSRGKYLRNLLIFAAVSELPFDLAISGKWWNTANQNVFFTLALGFAGIWLAEYLGRQAGRAEYKITAMVAMFLIAALADYMYTDYGGIGVLVIYAIYALRGRPVLAALAACGILTLALDMEVYSLFFVLVAACYNGERGRQNKYFFYIFYPAHLLLLVALRTLL